MILQYRSPVMRDVLLVSLLSLAQSTPSDVPPRLFLFTHSTSSSHLAFIFKLALKMESEDVYDVRWPSTEDIKAYPAPKHFKSVIFDRAIIFKEKLPDIMEEEGGWRGGSEMLNLLKSLAAMMQSLLLPCDFKDVIPASSSSDALQSLAIVETFSYWCAIPRARALHTDYVFVSPLVEISSASIISGASLPFSYGISVLLAKPFNEMGLIDRLVNVFAHSFFVILSAQLPVARFLFPGENAKYLDDVQPTMLIENSHKFVDWSVPVTRAQIRVGSFRNEIPSNESLDKDLSDFLEMNFEGFVIFSMSTFVSNGRMPDDIAASFSEAFSRLPRFGFIWRINELPARFLQSNVYAAKWIPQRTLLAHPRVLLLISHCGQNSFLEAVREAVPILGIPQMGDQFPTAKRVEAFGLGSVLYTSELNADRIHQSLEELLVNKTKGRRSALLREMLRTEEEFGMADDARWWLNYKLRHSADAFRSWVIPSGHRLRLLVRHGIDVLALLLIIITCTAIK